MFQVARKFDFEWNVWEWMKIILLWLRYIKQGIEDRDSPRFDHEQVYNDLIPYLNEIYSLFTEKHTENLNLTLQFFETQFL